MVKNFHFLYDVKVQRSGKSFSRQITVRITSITDIEPHGPEIKNSGILPAKCRPKVWYLTFWGTAHGSLPELLYFFHPLSPLQANQEYHSPETQFYAHGNPDAFQSQSRRKHSRQ